ncbi:MAG: hypothetical protein WC359_13270 [Dehalococcoidia bacterium]|jgi:hypothetical protein
MGYSIYINLRSKAELDEVMSFFEEHTRIIENVVRAAPTTDLAYSNDEHCFAFGINYHSDVSLCWGWAFCAFFADKFGIGEYIYDGEEVISVEEDPVETVLDNRLKWMRRSLETKKLSRHMRKELQEAVIEIQRLNQAVMNELERLGQLWDEKRKE